MTDLYTVQLLDKLYEELEQIDSLLGALPRLGGEDYDETLEEIEDLISQAVISVSLLRDEIDIDFSMYISGSLREQANELHYAVYYIEAALGLG